MYIKELLSIKGITQKELAERMGVSLSAVKQMVLITTATLSNSPFPILSSFANIGKVDSHCDGMWEFFIDPQKRERAGTQRFPKCGAKLVLTAEE